MANNLFWDLNLHASTSHYAFTSPSSPSAPTLVIDRPSGDIRLSDGPLLGGKRVSSISGILGIIKLRLDKYVLVATKSLSMGKIKGHTVYKVLATEFLPLRERPLHDAEEDNYLQLLKSFIKSSPLYFSYSLDLTNSFQRQAIIDPSQPLWKRADDRFFWNKFIQSDLIDFRTSGTRQHNAQQPAADPFILPAIFGMLRITPTSVTSTQITIALITRRSRHRAGTRYFSRGIDENGHASNFNETEQIILINDNTSGMGGFAGGGGMQNGKVGGSRGETQIMSYVQTRGSVPVFWAEVNTLHYTPKLQIRGVESAVDAAKIHFDEQIRLYGDNYLVNLVNQKGREERVKAAYEQMIRLIQSAPGELKSADPNVTDEKFRIIEPQTRQQQFDRLHYIYFDFHNETKGLQWHRAQLLLDRLGDALVKQQYFRGVDMPGDVEGRLEVRNLQTSVVRTNCMDCLDRTNVVQSMLARYSLNRQLTDLGILKPGETFSSDNEFEVLFRNLWADNADVVSKSYSGTGALKTDFTRTGKRTKAGALQDLQNSITRYARNNFADGPKQDAFDLFLGAYLPTSQNSPDYAFIDNRPVLIQAVPFILASSIFIVTIAMFTGTQLQNPWLFFRRAFVFSAFLIGVYAVNFIYSYGMLYVNWPRLNPRPWAIEGTQEALNRVRNDKIVGPLLAGTALRHDRGLSAARFLSAEEGKKRIE